MSAQQPPDPETIVGDLGVDPAEAQALADAMAPLQDLTGVGGSLGSALANVDAPGPQFVGTMLQTVALQANLASTSVESLARAIELYVGTQTESLETLFPPPDRIAAEAGEEAAPLVEALRRVTQ